MGSRTHTLYVPDGEYQIPVGGGGSHASACQDAIQDAIQDEQRKHQQKLSALRSHYEARLRAASDLPTMESGCAPCINSPDASNSQQSKRLVCLCLCMLAPGFVRSCDGHVSRFAWFSCAASESIHYEQPSSAELSSAPSADTRRSLLEERSVSAGGLPTNTLEGTAQGSDERQTRALDLLASGTPSPGSPGSPAVDPSLCGCRRECC